MGFKKGIILLMIAYFILSSISYVFSKEEDTVSGPPIQESAAEPEIQWVWGEITSVDVPNNKFNVKYLDYEFDLEKEISINVNEKTTYENIESFNRLKPTDAVSIDYIISPEGINLAKNISLENPQEAILNPQEGQAQDTGQSQDVGE